MLTPKRNTDVYKRQDQDFDTDSFRYKCRTIAGVGVMDWRGFVKNPGA